MGIEPTALAWEARVLPLYDARGAARFGLVRVAILMAGAARCNRRRAKAGASLRRLVGAPSAATATTGRRGSPAGRGSTAVRGKIYGPSQHRQLQMIQLTINGKPQRIDDAQTVLALLESMQLLGKRLAVERNGEIVPKGRHADTMLADGDRLEIVVAVGGG